MRSSGCDVVSKGVGASMGARMIATGSTSVGHVRGGEGLNRREPQRLAEPGVVDKVHQGVGGVDVVDIDSGQGLSCDGHGEDGNVDGVAAVGEWDMARRPC